MSPQIRRICALVLWLLAPSVAFGADDTPETPTLSALARLRAAHAADRRFGLVAPPASELAHTWDTTRERFLQQASASKGEAKQRLDQSARELLGVHALVVAELDRWDREIEMLGSPAGLIERQARARAQLEADADLVELARRVATEKEWSAAEVRALVDAKAGGAEASARPILRAGGLPYGPLDLPPRPLVLEPALTPVWLDAADPGVVAADYAPTGEAPLSAAIVAQAEALGYDPLAIWHFVHNEIVRELYAGARYGAEATLARRAGNDVDQASLLIALLRASSFAARYVHGVIELPRDRLAEDLGTTDPLRQAEALGRAGIASEPILGAGGIVGFRVEHTWVTAWIPYANYRGTIVDFSGRTWVPLAPALERHDLERPTPLLGAAGIGVGQILEQTLTEVDPRTPLERTREALETWLVTTGGGDLASHRSRWPVREHNLTVVPQTLPVVLVAVTEQSAELSPRYRSRLRLQARRADGTTILDSHVPLAALAGREVVLSALPAEVEDHEIVNQAGGMDSAPAWLVEVRLQLEVDGRRLVVGEGSVGLGLPVTLDFELVGPWGTQRVDAPWIAGAYGSLSIGDVALLGPAPEDLTAGRILAELASGYSESWRAAEDEIGDYLDVAALRPLPALAIVANSMELEVLGGLPWRLVWDGVSVDAAMRPVEVVVRGSAPGAARDFVTFAGLEGSALERTLLERELLVASISADRVVALARAAGAEVLEWPAGTSPEVADGLLHPPAVRALVASHLDAGLAVTIPRAEVGLSAWRGSGWRAADPVSGAAGYFLSGAIAGGESVEPTELWPSWFASILGNPYLEGVNRNPLAGTKLLKLPGGDGQDVTVGALAPRPLEVLVADAEGFPVEGADVTFSTVPAHGGGLRVTPTSPTAPTATVLTNRAGIARVWLEVGQQTAANPVFGFVDPGDVRPTQALEQRVEVIAQGAGGPLLVDSPFVAYGLPGAARSLRRINGPPGVTADLRVSATATVVSPGALIEVQTLIDLVGSRRFENAELVTRMVQGGAAVATWTDPVAEIGRGDQVAFTHTHPGFGEPTTVLLSAELRTAEGELVAEAVSYVVVQDSGRWAAGLVAAPSTVVPGAEIGIVWSLRDELGVGGADGNLRWRLVDPITSHSVVVAQGPFVLEPGEPLLEGSFDLDTTGLGIGPLVLVQEIEVEGLPWLTVATTGLRIADDSDGTPFGLVGARGQGLRVLVLDRFDNPVSNVPVRFEALPVTFDEQCVNRTPPAATPQVELLESLDDCDGPPLFGSCSPSAYNQQVLQCLLTYRVAIGACSGSDPGCGAAALANLGACPTGGIPLPSLVVPSWSTGASAQVILGGDVAAFYSVGISAPGISESLEVAYSQGVSTDQLGRCTNDPFGSRRTVDGFEYTTSGRNASAAAPAGLYREPLTVGFHAWSELPAIPPPGDLHVVIFLSSGTFGTCELGNPRFEVAGANPPLLPQSLPDFRVRGSVGAGGAPGASQVSIVSSGYTGRFFDTLTGQVSQSFECLSSPPPEPIDVPLDTLWAVRIDASVPGRVELGDDGSVLAPVEVRYVISPSDYVGQRAQIFLYERGVHIATFQGSSASAVGTASILRGRRLDIESPYEVEVVLNYGWASEIRSNRVPLRLRQDLFADVSRSVTAKYEIDVATSRRCVEATGFHFTLLQGATVSLVARSIEAQASGGGPTFGSAIEVLQSVALAEGEHHYTVDLDGAAAADFSLPPGDYVFELHGVSLIDPSLEETVTGTFQSTHRVHDSRPVGHEMLRGIDLFDGHLTRSVSDLELPGRGPTLRLARTYSSTNSGRGSLGEGWVHNWESRIVLGTCGEVIVIGGDGGGQRFVPDGDGGFEPMVGYHGTLVTDGTGFDFYPKNGDRWHYDRDSQQSWRLAFVEDPSGNRLSLSYELGSGSSRLLSVRDAGGRTLVFDYTAQSFLTWSTDRLLYRIRGPEGFELGFEYDDWGFIERVRREGNSRIEEYEYDRFELPDEALKRNLMTAAVDGLTGARETFEWEVTRIGVEGQPYPTMAVSRNVAPEGGEWHFTWDTAGLASRNPTVSTTVVDARGETTVYTADRYGSLVSVRDPLLQTTIREWDPRHRRPTLLVDARGVETTWTYDDHGNPTSERVERTGPLGLEVFTTTTAYADPSVFTPPYIKDRATSRTDRTGQLFELEWDAKGRLLAELTTVEPLEGASQLVRTSHAYQDNGDRRSTTDPRGFTTTFTYDAYGLPRMRRDPRGGERTSVHDSRGRLRELVDEEGRRTQFVWDALDRQIEVTHPDGTAQTWEYRDTDREVDAIDERLRTTTTHFDLEGRVVLVEDPAGGQMVTQWSPAGDKLLETRFFDADTPRIETTFGYDPLGRLEWRQEPEGRRMTFGYDPVGNVVHETLVDTTPGSTFLTRETERDYDALSRVVAERRRLDGNWIESERTLDGEGRPILEIDPLNREISRQFDGLGRLLEELRPLGARTRREYDPAGNLLRERISNTQGGQAFDQVRLREYDELGRLTSETDAEGKVRRLQYDKVGNIVRREDRRGVVTELVWDSRDRLRFERLRLDRFSVPPRGIAETAYTYDAVGNLETETWPNGNVLTHLYDALDRRTETTDLLGLVSRAEYDARGNVTARIDGEGRRSESDYDGLDREVERREPEARVSNWTWDVVGNRLSETNPRRYTTAWRYDQLERVVEEEDARSETSRFEYDDVGNRTAVIDRRGSRTETDYDDLNRPIVQRDPVEVGSQVSWAYDLVGNVVGETDRRGYVTSHTYDRENRRLTTHRDGVLTVETVYDAEGNAQLVKDANSHAVSYERDERGEVLRETRPLASVVRYTRDLIGNVVHEIDPENRGTSRGFDLRRRATSETNNAGETTRTEYDLVGNRTAVVRPMGEAYRFEYDYDGANRLVAVRNPLGHETEHEYDHNGNRTATVDAEGRRTVWEYDELDRMSLERLADAATTTFEYDPEGNRVGMVDPRGLTTTWQHDALGREVRATFQIPTPATGEDLVERRTTYDPNGNVVRVEEDFDGAPEPRVVTQSFDHFDRLFSRTDQHGHTIGHRYDLVGNRVQLIGPDGSVTRYGFDALNRLISVQPPASGATSYSWLRDRRLAQVTHPQGAAEARSYDAAGRLARLTNTQHAVVVTEYTYSYDANGNRLSQDEINGGGPEHTSYAFDLADRLTAIEYPTSRRVEYVLDRVGNRVGETTFSLGGGGPPQLSSDLTLIYDLRHRLVAANDALDGSAATSWTWDAAGNQTGRSRAGVTETYSHDALGRLIEAQRDGLLVERYRYDERGLRIRSAGSGAVTSYVRDDGAVLAAFDDSGSLRRRYEYGPDRLLSLFDQAAAEPERRQYYLFDGLGSTTALLRQDGLVQARRRWDAWGELLAGTGETSNAHWYTGHELDEATGLIYARARYYDPEVGRFLSRDPFEGRHDDPPSLHRYLYAHANPTVYWDPTGEATVSVFGRFEIEVPDEWVESGQRFLAQGIGFSVHLSNQATSWAEADPEQLVAGVGAMAYDVSAGAIADAARMETARRQGPGAVAIAQAELLQRRGQQSLAAAREVARTVPGAAAADLAVQAQAALIENPDSFTGHLKAGAAQAQGLVDTISLAGPAFVARAWRGTSVVAEAATAPGAAVRSTPTVPRGYDYANYGADTLDDALRMIEQPLAPGRAVKPGATGAYGDLTARRRAFGQTEPLHMDHQPSYAAQRAAAEQALGRPLTPAEARALRASTPAVASPKAVHQETSPTYGGRNTPARIANDAADLRAAQERDRAVFDNAMRSRQ